jgi:hypothetical protein
MRMELLNRPDIKPVLLPERSLHDSHWGYHFADCRLFPVTAAYTADVTSPLVTVFRDGADGRRAGCALERKGSRLTVRFPGGESVSFDFADGAWRLCEGRVK